MSEETVVLPPAPPAPPVAKNPPRGGLVAVALISGLVAYFVSTKVNEPDKKPEPERKVVREGMISSTITKSINGSIDDSVKKAGFTWPEIADYGARFKRVMDALDPKNKPARRGQADFGEDAPPQLIAFDAWFKVHSTECPDCSSGPEVPICVGAFSRLQALLQEAHDDGWRYDMRTGKWIQQKKVLKAEKPPSDRYTFEESQELAKRYGIPLLALVGADWCPHCKTTLRNVRDMQSNGELKDIVFAYVDQDKEPAAAATLKRDSYLPQMLFFRDPQAKATAWHTGAMNAVAIRELVR